MAVVEARAISVRRSGRTVLEGVDLDLEAGRALHLAGPNGSGKTSLLRVLAGLAAPWRGTVRREARIAFVPDPVALAPALRCGEWLGAMRRLRGLEAAAWDDLDPAWLSRPGGALSRGQLQRVGLAEALASDAAVLLLDEPFAGLDEPGRDWLGTRLRERLASGAAVAFSDHSGAGRGRLAGVRSLALGDGRSAPDPPSEVEVVISASHPDGRRLRRRVPAAASDDLLRELLAGGWHVEGVGR